MNISSHQKNPKIIAVTGGIGSGKSTVTRLFSELGITIIDTDVIARELVIPNQFAYHEIVQHFGKELLQDNQEIDRKKLRHIIFSNLTEKTWLENLLHPLILQTAKEKIKQATSSYVLLVIPLLCESKFNWDYDRVLVVDCPEHLQIQRVIARDHIDETLAKKMLSSQCSRQQRLALADDVIINEGDLEELKIAVLDLDKTYKAVG